MANNSKEESPGNLNPHSEAVPPDVLAAKLDALKADLKNELGDAFRVQAQLLLDEYTGLKPLLDVADVAKTLNVSPRTVEKLIGLDELRPLWIKGQRRFHPDVVMAYLQTCEKQPRRRPPGRRGQG